jgi:peptide/nickel transport system substrate-binding protein
MDYFQAVFDPLMKLTPAGEEVPWLATSWTYNDNQTVLTVKLRSGVRFTDGTVFNASVVKANLLHTETGTNEAAEQLKAIKTVAVINPYTVAITLSAPDPAFVEDLAGVPSMMASPAHMVNPQVPVGTGPYELDLGATTVGSVWSFTPNPDYWNKSFPLFSRVDIKYYSDQTAILDALRSGQINAAEISRTQVSAARGAGLRVTTYTPGDIEGVYIWDKAGRIVPALGKVQVRQAINYAFDRPEIVKIADDGLGVPTEQVFNPETSAYVPALDKTYSYDPAKAKQLLAQAGYPKGFSVTVPDLSSLFPAQQAAMDEELGAIGITVHLVTVPIDQLFTDIEGGKFAMSWFELASHAPWDRVTEEILPTASYNPLHYSDPTIASLVAKIPNAKEAVQTGLFRQLNRYLVNQGWDAPWDFVQDAEATTGGITVTPSPFLSQPAVWDYLPPKG